MYLSLVNFTLFIENRQKLNVLICGCAVERSLYLETVYNVRATGYFLTYELVYRSIVESVTVLSAAKQ